jgi:hypothetical protein
MTGIIGNAVIDRGLSVLRAEVTDFILCSAMPTTRAEASGVASPDWHPALGY